MATKNTTTSAQRSTDEPVSTGNQQSAKKKRSRRSNKGVGKEATQFKKGQSGNPRGREKGSRNKLSEAFLAALHEDFTEHGVDAIQAVRERRPHDYLRVIAKVVPKEMDIELPKNSKIKVEFVN